MRAVYYVSSPLPLAGFVLAIRHYSKVTEGWGTWAAVGSIAPLFMGVSAILGVVGLVLTVWFRGRGRPVLGLSLATLLASSIALIGVYQIVV